MDVHKRLSGTYNTGGKNKVDNNTQRLISESTLPEVFRAQKVANPNTWVKTGSHMESPSNSRIPCGD